MCVALAHTRFARRYVVLFFNCFPFFPSGLWLPLTLLSTVPCALVTTLESKNNKIRKDGYYMVSWLYVSNLTSAALSFVSSAAIQSGLEGSELAMATTAGTQFIAGGAGYCVKTFAVR